MGLFTQDSKGEAEIDELFLEMFIWPDLSPDFASSDVYY